MTFSPQPKKKRIVDKKLLKELSYLPCVVCGCEERTPPHHMTTVGAGGDDTIDNLLPLCGEHHTQIHYGQYDFIFDNPAVFDWVMDHGREDLI